MAKPFGASLGSAAALGHKVGGSEAGRTTGSHGPEIQPN
jgi:hypothetical protein